MNRFWTVVMHKNRICLGSLYQLLAQQIPSIHCNEGRAASLTTRRTTQAVLSPPQLSQTSFATSLLVLKATTENRSSILRRTVRLQL